MIYIVEDDASIRELEQYALQSNGYEVQGFESAEPFWQAMRAAEPELVILDVMLPGEDGFSILKKLRNTPSLRRLPIIMVTAKSSELDTVRGLDCGADDYLTKPVDLDELLLHVQALLRRSQAMTSHQLTIGQTHLDYDSLTVQRGDTLLTLPKKEFFLLFKLLSSPMQIFTRRQLMDEIWGMDAQSDERTVDVHIKRLREKCEIFPDFSIVTVRGLGYKAVKNG